MPEIDFTEAQPYLMAVTVGVGLAVVLLFVKRLVWGRFLKWAKSTNRPWDEILLNQIRPPLNAILLLTSFSFALQLTPEWLRNQSSVSIAVKTLFILAVLWLVNRVLTLTVQFWRPLGALGENTHILILTVGRTVLIALTFLVVLDTFGISITPLLASLGVGSVAVALALQDTLSNFFSGIYILIDKPINVNDTVRLEGNLEGTVRKIGWRSTHILSGSNDTIVVPNSKLSSSVLTNFNMPDQGTNLTVGVGVDYGSDLTRVEAVAKEVASAVVKATPGGDPGFEPIFRYQAFADSSINFNITVRVKAFSDTGLMRHELIKAFKARFEKENIGIPFPQRVIHTAAK